MLGIGPAKQIAMMRSLVLLLIAMFIALPASPAWAGQGKDKVPDIRDIPRLKPGLKPGTLAWATIDQLHPTQPQTGKREVKRKRKIFLDLVPKNDKKFPKRFYKFLYRNNLISPVFIAKTPEYDSRHETHDFLGYISDRTHTENAIADMIYKRFGEDALTEPILDEKGRPLNFVLVRVVEDRSKLTPSLFARLMVREDHSYLELWSRGRNGNTVISPIDFTELPETVYETTDNPYRGLIGEAQNRRYLGRSKTDFSQFVAAKALYQNTKIPWDDISHDASDKQFEKAMDQAKDFFDSRAAVGVPGADPSDVPRSCKAIFKP